MTLKEKFLNSPCEKGYVNTNVYRAENNVKIADDYAVEFGEWIKNSSIKNTDLPISVLLKMFKNQK